MHVKKCHIQEIDLSSYLPMFFSHNLPFIFLYCIPYSTKLSIGNKAESASTCVKNERGKLHGRAAPMANGLKGLLTHEIVIVKQQLHN